MFCYIKLQDHLKWEIVLSESACKTSDGLEMSSSDCSVSGDEVCRQLGGFVIGYRPRLVQ